MPIYFPKQKATFIQVPKTGGTSFYKWVYNNIPQYEQPNQQNSYVIGSIDGSKQFWPELGIVFSFVRNPFSRLVSMYFYQYKEAQRIIKETNNVKKTIDMARTIAISSKGFDYWIESVCLKKEELYIIGDANPNHMNISSWFSGKKPDIICKLENIQHDFKQVQELLQCFVPLPHENITEHKPYREYYNTYTKSLVEKMFKEDLDNFNYDF